MGVLFDELLQFLDVPLYCLLAWGNNGLEAERISPAIRSGVGLSHGELSDGPSEKIKPYPLLMEVERVRDVGFARFQFQPHLC